MQGRLASHALALLSWQLSINIIILDLHYEMLVYRCFHTLSYLEFFGQFMFFAHQCKAHASTFFKYEQPYSKHMSIKRSLRMMVSRTNQARVVSKFGFFLIILAVCNPCRVDTCDLCRKAYVLRSNTIWRMSSSCLRALD